MAGPLRLALGTKGSVQGNVPTSGGPRADGGAGGTACAQRGRSQGHLPDPCPRRPGQAPGLSSPCGVFEVAHANWHFFFCWCHQSPDWKPHEGKVSVCYNCTLPSGPVFLFIVCSQDPVEGRDVQWILDGLWRVEEIMLADIYFALLQARHCSQPLPLLTPGGPK